MASFENKAYYHLICSLLLAGSVKSTLGEEIIGFYIIFLKV